MPNGYSFLLVIIMIALAGGLVSSRIEVQELKEQAAVSGQENAQIYTQLDACQQKSNTCQADLQKTQQELADARAAIEKLKGATACQPAPQASTQDTTPIAASNTSGNGRLARTITLAVTSLGMLAGGLAWVFRSKDPSGRRKPTQTRQPNLSASREVRTFYVKVTENERVQLVKQRRNRE